MENYEIDFMNILNSINDIKLTERTKGELEFTLEQYYEYLARLDSLSKEELKRFLTTMKEEEMISTQRLENEPSHIIASSMIDLEKRTDSIAYLTEKHLTYGNIIIPNIKRLHSILMEGTSIKSDRDKNFRDNEVFVGYYIDGEKHIQYIPPKPEQINGYMRKVMNFYNDSKYHRTEEQLFLHPLIAHVLIAIVQPFKDGNTRVGRVLNSVAFLYNTNTIYNKDYQLPIIYLSREYFAWRKNYRDLINKIASEPSNETWNRWFIFNLHLIQDRMNYATSFIEENFKK